MMTTADQALHQIASITGKPTYMPSPDRSLGFQVAQALGWQEGMAHVESAKQASSPLSFVRGYLGPQRAAVFATDRHAPTSQSLPEAALFAYHSSIHWGLVASDSGATVFNSHWIKEDQWFHLPQIEWTDIDRHRDVLQALTPSGIESGELDKLAARLSPPDRVLKPVDDALVTRLDFWRREALRYGHNVEHLDEELHILFAQFFILRAVEDRKLAPELPSLGGVLTAGRVNRERLFELFESARGKIQSNLFQDAAFSAFPDFIIAGIICDLYTPVQLPHSAQRYNFAWIDADVLGRAYEKYLATVFVPEALSPQLALFDQPIREVAAVGVKKSGGVFYTPDYLVGALTEQAISKIFEAHSEPGFIPRIIDLACGSGSFLVEAVSILLRQLRQRDANANWARSIIEERRIIGIDVDPRAVTLTRMNLWIRLTDEPNALPLPSIDQCVVEGDSLAESVWQGLPSEYDIVLGNPPFIATSNVQSREELSKRFRTAVGRFDYSYLFLELAIQKLAPAGILGMVIPNRLFRNRDAGSIRDLLTSSTTLLSVLDFGTAEVFQGTSAYIGAIIARKHSGPSDSTDQICAVLISDVSDPRYLGGIICSALQSTTQIQNGLVISFNIDKQPKGTHPWVLLSPERRNARIKLEEESVPLGEIAGIYQGIRTGANDIYIVHVESDDGIIASVANGFGDTANLESSLLHPVVFGSDIQRYAPLTTNRAIIYPYLRGLRIPEAELSLSYPLTHAYFERYREMLSARSSIASSALMWYEVVRKRDESWLTSYKLVTRDLATRTSFTLDDAGQVFLVGGTAVVPSSIDLTLPLLAYLNSRLASEYLAGLTPAFRGSFQKYEPQHLSQLPVASFMINSTEFATKLGDLALQVLVATQEGQGAEADEQEHEIDRLVEESLGIRR